MSSAFTWVLVGSLALYAVVFIIDKIIERRKRKDDENNFDKGDET